MIKSPFFCQGDKHLLVWLGRTLVQIRIYTQNTQTHCRTDFVPVQFPCVPICLLSGVQSAPKQNSHLAVPSRQLVSIFERAVCFFSLYLYLIQLRLLFKAQGKTTLKLTLFFFKRLTKSIRRINRKWIVLPRKQKPFPKRKQYRAHTTLSGSQ